MSTNHIRIRKVGTQSRSIVKGFDHKHQPYKSIINSKDGKYDHLTTAYMSTEDEYEHTGEDFMKTKEDMDEDMHLDRKRNKIKFQNVNPSTLTPKQLLNFKKTFAPTNTTPSKKINNVIENFKLRKKEVLPQITTERRIPAKMSQTGVKRDMQTVIKRRAGGMSIFVFKEQKTIPSNSDILETYIPQDDRRHERNRGHVLKSSDVHSKTVLSRLSVDDSAGDLDVIESKTSLLSSMKASFRILNH